MKSYARPCIRLVAAYHLTRTLPSESKILLTLPQSTTVNTSRATELNAKHTIDYAAIGVGVHLTEDVSGCFTLHAKGIMQDLGQFTFSDVALLATIKHLKNKPSS